MQRIVQHFQRGGNHISNNNNNNNVPIRTVYVAPINSAIIAKIKPYFEAFGEVDTVRFHTRDTFQYAFVQFKKTKIAEAVLSKGSHCIANWNFNVKPADSWHQPKLEDPLSIPPDQDSPSHIFNTLNDDCLREIFQYFNVKDLSTVAEVCVRFNQQAKETFAKKHKELMFSRYYLGFDQLEKEQIERLLCNFGSLIHSLKIDADSLQFETAFFRALNQYCTSQLKELELSSFVIKGKLMKKLRPIFASLEHLRLNNCAFKDDVTNLMSACTHVKNLVLNRCDIDKGKGLKQKFTNLDEAHFISNSMGDCVLNGFIESNPTLTKLTILDNCIASTKFFRVIGENLPNLMECRISEEIYNGADIFIEDIKHLSHLNSMKTLKLNFSDVLIEPLVKSLIENKVPIEHFCAINGELSNEAIASISKMKQIKKLELLESDGTNLTDEQLIELAKELPELEELHLREIQNDLSIIGLKKMLVHAKKLSILKLQVFDNIIIDVDDYNAMLKTIQNRPDKIKLLIELTSEGEKVNVPEEILDKNRDIFYIDEHIEVTPIIGSSDSDEDSMFNELFLDDDDDDDDDYYYHYSDADSEEGFAIGCVDGRVFFIG